MKSHGVTVCQLLLTLDVGGAEALAVRLARRLADRYRFVFGCLEGHGPLSKQLRDDGFPVFVLNKRPGLDWRIPNRLRALLRRERVALVHAHQYGPFLYAALSRLLSARPPVLFLEHGRAHPDVRRRSHTLFNPCFLRRRDRVVSVGEAVRLALIDNEGFPADRVEVVYNGIDVFRFEQAGRYRDEVRRELGIGPDDFVLLMAARLDPIKAHTTAIRAAVCAAACRAGVRLLVAGDGPEAGVLEALVRREGLGDCVRLLGMRRDVPRLFGAADAVLLTSHSEGIPLALIEGMAAGLPVIATRVGGVPEVVLDEQTGLLAPAGDEAVLTAHMLRLAAAPDLCKRLGSAGQARAKAVFLEDEMVTRYDHIYREMLAPLGEGLWPCAALGRN